jgi:hypothetical protein
VQDHYNGLLLLSGDGVSSSSYYVCNPATVRCAHLQRPPMRDNYCNQGLFLAFDPAVSRHHEVFLFPQTMTQLRPEKEVVQRRHQAEPSWMDISMGIYAHADCLNKTTRL